MGEGLESVAEEVVALPAHPRCTLRPLLGHLDDLLDHLRPMPWHRVRLLNFIEEERARAMAHAHKAEGETAKHAEKKAQ